MSTKSLIEDGQLHNGSQLHDTRHVLKQRKYHECSVACHTLTWQCYPSHCTSHQMHRRCMQFQVSVCTRKQKPQWTQICSMSSTHHEPGGHSRLWPHTAIHTKRTRAPSLPIVNHAMVWDSCSCLGFTLHNIGTSPRSGLMGGQAQLHHCHMHAGSTAARCLTRACC